MHITYRNLINSLRQNFRELLELRRFKFFPLIGFKAKFHLYPFKVAFRKNNSQITVYNPNHLQLLKLDQNVRYDEMTQSFRFNSGDKQFIFYGAEHNGDLVGIFYLHEYDLIEVAGKTVIDIGANIGDSSIYFVSKGARRVIAVEPNRQSFNYLVRNCSANLMDNLILPLNESWGCAYGFAKIQNISNTTGTLFDGIIPMSSPGEDSIQIQNINYMISAIQDTNIVLKIDCEGCEYDLIHCMNQKSFEKIGQIFIEYHFGEQDLSKIITSNGFLVSNSHSTYSYVKGVIRGERIMGKIIAKR